ncbi:hypothetical protein EGH21_02790 [Halomicroarcula sp. F13]|uniref:CcmD family protein n=1 Tax=Haloarcula rubra TaxID=2487747 RepID=A0AAW4PKA8_9EURY|nr:hypothetical protein [Halomicroarcula rubra]MBX0321953.1 hypothetical protein [Halomicroarcula rubra]
MFQRPAASVWTASDADPSLYTPVGRFGTFPVGGTDFSQPVIYVYLVTMFAVFGLYVALRRDTLERFSDRYAVTDELEN